MTQLLGLTLAAVMAAGILGATSWTANAQRAGADAGGQHYLGATSRRERRALRSRIARKDDRLPARFFGPRYQQYSDLPLWAAKAFLRHKDRRN